jgi:hypothetical protein
MRRVVGFALGWIVALTLGGSPPASAAPDVVRQASCDGQYHSRAQLELTDKGDQIKVRLKLDGPDIQALRWEVRLRRIGHLILRRTMFSDDDGYLSVQRRVRDRDGTDTFRARAEVGGTVCAAHATI